MYSKKKRGSHSCTTIRPNWKRADDQLCSAFHQSVGENIASAINPLNQGHGVNSHLRISGTNNSQTKMLAAKRNIVYFDKMPIPKTTLITSHHLARPVVRSLANVSSRNAVAATSGPSGVAMIDPAAMTSVKLKYSAALAPTVSPKRIVPDRQTAQVAGKASSTPIARTPNSVLPNSVVPSRIRMGSIGGWSK